MSLIRRSFVAGALVICALLFLSLGKPDTANAAPLWSDLSADLLASYGLTQEDIGAMSNGYPDGTWRPSEYVTRSQFVHLALGCFRIHPAHITQQHFSDLPPSSPHYGWVEAALEVGLIQGYEAPSPGVRTVFGSYDPVTREQAVTILMRYLSKTDPVNFDYSAYTAERCAELLAPFSDKEQVRRAQEVAMALDTEVLRPAGAAIMSQAHLTRIQAAALIARVQGLVPPYEPPTPDPDWGMSNPLSWLTSDAGLYGIQAGSMELGSAAPWMPRTLTVRAEVPPGEDSAAYQETAELLASLAEQYKGLMKYEQVRIVLTIPGGTWVYDHTFEEAPLVPAYPPMTSQAFHDFYYGFSGDGYHTGNMVALHEGDTWVIRLVVRVEADRENRETYDAIYDYVTNRARQYGVAAGENELLRIVLVEATPIPPMGEPELKVLESRDFDLTTGG